MMKTKQQKKNVNVKLLKLLPIIGVILAMISFFLFEKIDIWLINRYQNNMPLYDSNIYVKIFHFGSLTLTVLYISMILIPTIYIGINLIRNKNFRELIINSELGDSGQDERESLIVAFASKRAFAVTHLAILAILCLLIPFSFLSGIIPPLRQIENLFYMSPTISYAIALSIPLIVGSYVFHANIQKMNKNGIEKIVEAKMNDQETTEIPVKTKWLWLIVGLGVGLTIGTFLTSNIQNQQASQEPIMSKEMQNKYQELLKNLPEKKAQDEFINWLKAAPMVYGVEKNEGEYPGVNANFCIGGAQGGGYSWESLKNSK